MSKSFIIGSVQWFTYILKCSDGSFYVGHTKNLDQRLKAHNAGQGAIYTKIRRPVKLVYSEAHTSQVEATTREQQIKRWSRAKKLALIGGRLERLHDLAKRRGE